METSKTTHLILADSNQLIRVGLEAVLKLQPDIKIVGQAENASQLRELMAAHRVDVVMIDFTAPHFSVEIIPEIHQTWPDVKFLAITPDQSGQTIVNALRAGVSSYIKKDCDLGEIVDSVRQTGSGERFFCGKILRAIREQSIDVNDQDLANFMCEPVILSEREQEIITLIAEGYTNTMIAEKLFLSPHTVNTHRKNVMQKLGVKNTAAIVMYAVKSNLVNVNKFLFSVQDTTKG